MRLSRASFAVAIPLAIAAALAACSGTESEPVTGTGGSASGGAVTSGGNASGGNASGGNASGGSAFGGVATSGGASTSGGAAPSGGGSNSGGATSGGAQSSGGSSGASGGASGGSGIPATFETVKFVIREVPCFGAGCHNDEQNPLNMMLDEQLHSRLTSRISAHCGNIPVVNPGKPNESALIKILKGPCGTAARMPIGCVEDSDANCVPPDYIAAMTQWIANGAPK